MFRNLFDRFIERFVHPANNDNPTPSERPPHSHVAGQLSGSSPASRLVPVRNVAGDIIEYREVLVAVQGGETRREASERSSHHLHALFNDRPHGNKAEPQRPIPTPSSPLKSSTSTSSTTNECDNRSSHLKSDSLRSPSPPILYRKVNGEFLPFIASKPRDSSRSDHTTHAPSKPTPTVISPVDSDGPVRLQFRTHDTAPNPSAASLNEQKNSAFLYARQGGLAEHWDGWPDGDFDLDLDHSTFAATKNLLFHWAMKVSGGDKNRAKDASRWEDGKRSYRKCLGHIACINNDCHIILRPVTETSSREKQLARRCQCGSRLQYHPCAGNVRSILYNWKNGVYYRNNPHPASTGGFHGHPRLTHELHLTANAEAQFRELVNHHPKLKPLEAVVGLPTLAGPHGKSTADIAIPLINANRVAYEKRKLKGSRVQNGSNFLHQYKQFKKENPDFVIQERFTDDGVIVISLQHRFMRQQLVKELVESEAVNGLVSDGAHGWWRERNDILIVSSAYSPTLHCWVPGIFSYSNGASGQHFLWHFYALFKSMDRHARHGDLLLELRHFATVMDFSDAERRGFILALVRFLKRRWKDLRSDAELTKLAEGLLKGCDQHFKNACTRIKKISSVIPVDDQRIFERQCRRLHHVKDHASFLIIVREMVAQWPKLDTWLAWWCRPSHASMIFKSQIVMDIDLWLSIPDSSNAEEAMHWKLYCGAGRDHDVIDGFYALKAMAEYFERLFQHKLVGSPTSYGEPEPWKIVAAEIGRTKPTRAPDAPARRRIKNDGRAPDTVKELHKGSTQKSTAHLEETLVELTKSSSTKGDEKRKEEKEESGETEVPRKREHTDEDDHGHESSTRPAEADTNPKLGSTTPAQKRKKTEHTSSQPQLPPRRSTKHRQKPVKPATKLRSPSPMAVLPVTLPGIPWEDMSCWLGT